MSETQLVTAERGNVGMTARGLRFESFNDLWRFSTMVSKTDFCPPGWTPEKCLVAIQFGMEVGLSPMQSLQNIAVSNGKPWLYGDAPLALARNHRDWDGGVFLEWTEGTGDKFTAYCRVGRRSETACTQSFSWAQARDAGLLGKDTWKKYPARMLQFRARQLALRDKFGDVLKGLVTEDEALEIAETNGNAPRAVEARVIHHEPEPARKELAEPVPASLPPKATAEPARASGTAWTSDQIKANFIDAPAVARLERQELAAEGKKSGRPEVIRIREYALRMKAEGLEWRDFIMPDWKGKGRTDVEIGAYVQTLSEAECDRILHRMIGASSDAFFERQNLPDAKDPKFNQGPEREPGADEEEGHRETGSNE